eukprot:TRINITY_DN13405_c1_g1_i1.p1 TRINITY_DN13405_c1_g1~~TRINITY_DN13405_c1_g1_i1.p1  ORF type:complete len:1009 (+),score=172.04 TRINITY_DN13405_c1_g1_i1:58-3027(+)
MRNALLSAIVGLLLLGYCEAEWSYSYMLWTNPQRIPYYFATDFATSQIKDAFEWTLKTWENKTCLRFYEIDAPLVNESYMRIQNTTEGLCTAFKRERYGPINVTLGVACRGGWTLAAFTAALGMSNMQVRSDRDDYIKLNLDNVPENDRRYYAIDDNVPLIGPYDYDSITHCGQAYPDLIESPKYTGQRVGPSIRDIDAINFYYNKCQPQTAPSCILTKEGSPVVSSGQIFNLTSTGHFYNKDTTLVGELYVNGNLHHRVESSNIPMGVPFSGELVYSAEGNNTYEFLFIFKSEDSATEGRCSISVSVIPDVICNGVRDRHDGCGGSSRGECQLNGRCKCYSPYSGVSCQGYEGCAENYKFPFDTDYGQTPTNAMVGNPILSHFTTGQDPVFAGSGARKFFAYGTHAVPEIKGKIDKPRLFTTYARRNTFELIDFNMLGYGSESCYSLHVECFHYTECTLETIGVDGVVRIYVPFQADQWTKFQLKYNYDNTKNGSIEVWVNDQKSAEMMPLCDPTALYIVSRFTKAAIQGTTFIDEASISCYDYLAVSGSLTVAKRSLQDDIRTGSTNVTFTFEGLESSSEDVHFTSCKVTSVRLSAVADIIHQKLCEAGTSTLKKETTIIVPPIPQYDTQVDDIIDIEITDSRGHVFEQRLRISGWCDQGYSTYENYTFPDETYVMLAGDQQPYRPIGIQYKKLIDSTTEKVEILLNNGNDERKVYLQLTEDQPLIVELPTVVKGDIVFKAGDFLVVDITFDFDNHLIDVRVNGTIQISSVVYPNDDFFKSSWGIIGLWLRKGAANGHSTTCANVLPVALPHNTVVNSPFEVVVARGSVLLSESDILYLTRPGDCLASPQRAVLTKIREDRTHWSVPAVSGNYSLCYSVGGSQPAQIIDTVMSVPAPVPPTSSPSSPAPPSIQTPEPANAGGIVTDSPSSDDGNYLLWVLLGVAVFLVACIAITCYVVRNKDTATDASLIEGDGLQEECTILQNSAE